MTRMRTGTPGPQTAEEGERPISGQGRIGIGVPLLRGLRSACVVVLSLLLVFSVAALDRSTGSKYSFSLFYLIPVAACAWWCGFPHGVLLAVASALAWHAVDCAADATAPI